MTSTRYLSRPGGRLAYDVTGEGPLVICVPGMGDIRATFRRLVPTLLAAGYRVATMDLRAHGDSDTTFSSYTVTDTGGDVLALAAELGGPAVLVGGSFGGGAVVWAAARQPQSVTALVLLGGVVRERRMAPGMSQLLALALRRPWGPAMWARYYRSLFKVVKPDDLDAHVAAILASLRRPGAWAGFRATAGTGVAAAAAALPGVSAPTFAVYGRRDPDFPDPAAEALFVSEHLPARTMLTDGGHYPQTEDAQTVGPAVVQFLNTLEVHA